MRLGFSGERSTKNSFLLCFVSCLLVLGGWLHRLLNSFYFSFLFCFFVPFDFFIGIDVG
ncbi:hypothetical protein BDQ94DRAFT_135328 [Aspergillus welwitschiae]|uniref:Uncharacterized protein n=1 Tax=Aspergillus welwitschiae TaxID=1341132 RepID=A0A3F3QFA6_9EURO|nr:hypothetical protein BDQ94DRAFT_135328 [Aspergillus welwitschiae]RDH37933.1 hypothetical protein BDQ94DRAFT_135328 [Aspergillus welwitschiae]